MNNMLFKYIRSLNIKNSNVSKKIPIIIIILLLIFQISITFSFCRRSSINNYCNMVYQHISSQITNEEERKDTISALVATIASDAGVLRLNDIKNPTYFDMVDTCSNIRKLMSISTSVSNIYVYNNKFGYLYDSCGRMYYKDDKNVEKIIEGIDLFFESKEKNILYSNPTNNKFYVDKNCLSIFNADSKKNDLIIVKDNLYSIFDYYQKIQSDTKSSLVVTTLNGDVIYGGGQFSFNENISETNVYNIAINNKGNPEFVVHESKRYLVCSKSSSDINRRYIVMIPKSNVINTGLVGKNYIYLYICIIVSILILVRTLSIWKNFSSLLIRQTVLAINKRKNNANTGIYNECGIPSEQNNKLNNFLTSIFGSSVYYTSLIMKISDFSDFSKKYLASDIALIKYGINNILDEIFSEADLKLCLANDVGDKIEYLIISNTQKSLTDIHSCCLKGISSIDDYINFNISFFVGETGNIDSILNSYNISKELVEYQFVHGDKVVLDSSNLISMNEGELLEARKLCDLIKNNIAISSEDFDKNFNKLKSMLMRMSPTQNYDCLCFLLFNVCSSIKDIELKNNLNNLIDISACFKTLIESENNENVLQIVELLYYDVKDSVAIKGDSKYDKLVDNCINIIKKYYSDNMLSVDFIAEKLNFSRGYLSRTYKSATGDSLSATIAEYRLDMAAKLLAETDKKVNDIVNEVGFVNSSHFSVLFKQRFGDSPTNYRKKHYSI